MTQSDARPKVTQTVTTAWHDRFVIPTEAALIEPLEPTQTELFTLLRRRLRDELGLTELILYAGVPWRWCFAYVEPSDAEDADEAEELEEPFAYLIPEPEKPQFALPLSEKVIEQFKLRRLSRPVRDGLIHARLVGGTVWAEWELTFKSQADELAGLAARKRELTSS